MKKGDLVNTRYGDVIVVEYNSSRDILVKFTFTGYEIRVLKHNLLKGSVKDPFFPCIYGIGFNGKGDHKTNASTKAYRVWIGMLCRCYTPRYPSYKGCTVCDEWHNFQNFAEWYEDNYIEGYQLDKDIKVIGNKIYSPDNCLFVTRELNSYYANLRTMYEVKFISKNNKIVSVFNINEFCRKNKLSAGNLNGVIQGHRSHHKGWRLYHE